MNCTICGKPVDEHGENEQTDICIVKKLGWKFSQEAPGIEYWCRINDESKKVTDGGWWLRAGDDKKLGWACANPACGPLIPHYSSPDMSADTWGLVERMGNAYILSNISKPLYDIQIVTARIVTDIYIKAPTPTLAICRAFLAQEEL